MRISDWSSDVCSSDLVVLPIGLALLDGVAQHRGDGLHHPEVGRQVWRNRRQMSLGQLAVLALLFFRQAAQLQDDLARIDVGDVVLELAEIGRASARERVCQYVWMPVVAVSLNKNSKEQIREGRYKK